MKYLLCLLAGAIALLTPSPIHAASWPMQGYDPQNTNFSPGERSITADNVDQLHATWTIRSTSQAVVAAGGRLYVSTTTPPQVDVVDARSGSQIRHFTDHQLGIGQQDSVTALAYGGGLLVVASALQMVALDTTHSRVVWRHRGGADALVLVGSIVYTGQGCQTFCRPPASIALHLRSGRLLWSHPGNFGGRPVVIGGYVYQAWGEGRSVARVYNRFTGRLIRTLPLSGQWLADRSDAYVATAPSLGGPQERWLAKTRANGTVAWRVSLGAPYSYADPALAYGRVYLPSNRYHPGILAVDTANGRVAWGAPIRGAETLIVANHLVFVAVATHIDILDANSGHLLRQVSLPPIDLTVTALIISNGPLYAVTPGGVSAVQ